jgi:hypothetical protein
LLGDLLPDAPREADLLVTAIRVGLVPELCRYADQGLDHTTAVRLAAASLSARTAFAPDVCEWAATELAVALRLARPDEPTAARLPADPAPARARAELRTPAASAPRGTERLTLAIGDPEPRPDSAETQRLSSRNWKHLALGLAAAVLILATAGSFAAGYFYNRPASASSAGSRHQSAKRTQSPQAAKSQRSSAMCTQELLTRAVAEANPQIDSAGWQLTSFACHGNWAAVSVNAPSVGPGEGFLLYTTSGWAGGQMDGGYYFCSHLASAFNPPVPPQALALALFTKAGLCPH